MKKILSTIALFLSLSMTSLVAPSSTAVAAEPAQRGCTTISNQGGAWSNTVGVSGRRGSSVSWKTRVAVWYRSCGRRVTVTQVQYQWILAGRERTDSECLRINEFRADPSAIKGWNSGPVAIPCVEGDSSRYMTFFPNVRVRAGASQYDQSAGGSWKAEIGQAEDPSGSYNRTFFRFGI